MKKFHSILCLLVALFAVGTITVSSSCLDILNGPLPAYTNHCEIPPADGLALAGVKGISGETIFATIVFVVLFIYAAYLFGDWQFIRHFLSSVWSKCCSKVQSPDKYDIQGAEVRPKYGMVNDVKPRHRGNARKSIKRIKRK